MQATIQAHGTTDDQVITVTVEKNASGRVWVHINDRSTGAAARLTPQMVRRLIASLEDTLVTNDDGSPSRLKRLLRAIDAPPEFDGRILG